MREGTGRAREGVDRGVRRGVSARACFGTTAVTARVHRPKAVHWEELTEVGAALSPRTRRPTNRWEAPRPKVRRLERADTEPLEEVRGLAARADEGRASPHEGDDLEGDDLAPPPEGEDLPPADEGEDSAAEEFDRKSAPRFSPAAAARLQEALDLAQAESSLAAPPGRWFEPGQEARKILLGTRVRGIEHEGAHLNVDALSRARVLVLEEEAAISSTVDDPLRLNDARLQPDILCEKYDWTKIDDDRDVAIVVEIRDGGDDGDGKNRAATRRQFLERQEAFNMMNLKSRSVAATNAPAQAPGGVTARRYRRARGPGRRARGGPRGGPRRGSCRRACPGRRTGT